MQSFLISDHGGSDYPTVILWTISRWGDASQGGCAYKRLPGRGNIYGFLSQTGTGSSGHKLFLLVLSRAPTPPLLFLGAVVPHVLQKETGLNGITPTQQDWAPCGFTGKGSLNQSVRRLHFKAPIWREKACDKSHPVETTVPCTILSQEYMGNKGT